MSEFLTNWNHAALTTLGFFWMAFWAFALGYIISSCIQVFVTRQRMQRTMGKAGPKSVALGTFFGFISSSCSFAALATAKSLYKKGAGLIPALAFLLASTNLVIELGIIIAIFLSWQFVVGEYLGGLLLILFMWVLVKLTLTSSLEEDAREHVGGGEDKDQASADWKDRITSIKGWRMVGKQYLMEWGMVWKDVTFGFTVAGIIAAFVPNAFFTTLFVGSGAENEPAFWQVLLQTVVGPVAAFFTFIGSMGNIPLASLLYSNGVSFAGIMAFIFSDLVVFPVLRITAKYFGWKMAVYILGVFLVSLIASALVLHYGFSIAGILPQGTGSEKQIQPSERLKIDYTFFFNLFFIAISGLLVWLSFSKSHQESDKDEDSQDGKGEHNHHQHGDEDDDESETSWADLILTYLAYASYVWLAGGLIAGLAT